MVGIIYGQEIRIQSVKWVSVSAVSGKELQTLEEIHVLDLAADGQIKPHIDSVKVRGEGRRMKKNWREGGQGRREGG